MADLDSLEENLKNSGRAIILESLPPSEDEQTEVKFISGVGINLQLMHLQALGCYTDLRINCKDGFFDIHSPIMMSASPEYWDFREKLGADHKGKEEDGPPMIPNIALNAYSISDVAILLFMMYFGEALVNMPGFPDDPTNCQTKVLREIMKSLGMDPAQVHLQLPLGPNQPGETQIRKIQSCHLRVGRKVYLESFQPTSQRRESISVIKWSLMSVYGNMTEVYTTLDDSFDAPKDVLPLDPEIASSLMFVCNCGEVPGDHVHVASEEKEEDKPPTFYLSQEQLEDDGALQELLPDNANPPEVPVEPEDSDRPEMMSSAPSLQLPVDLKEDKATPQRERSSKSLKRKSSQRRLNMENEKKKYVHLDDMELLIPDKTNYLKAGFLSRWMKGEIRKDPPYTLEDDEDFFPMPFDDDMHMELFKYRRNYLLPYDIWFYGYTRTISGELPSFLPDQYESSLSETSADVPPAAKKSRIIE